MLFRKWEKDIEVCVKRLFSFENAVKRWMNQGGGNMEIFGYLNLEGNSAIDLPRHPFLDLNAEEKKVWTQCFGKPLQVPKNLLTSITIRDFLDTAKAQREMYRECIAFTKNSRFRNKNYRKKPKAPQKKPQPKKRAPKPKKPYPKSSKGKRPGYKRAPKKKPYKRASS